MFLVRLDRREGTHEEVSTKLIVHDGGKNVHKNVSPNGDKSDVEKGSRTIADVVG